VVIVEGANSTLQVSHADKAKIHLLYGIGRDMFSSSQSHEVFVYSMLEMIKFILHDSDRVRDYIRQCIQAISKTNSTIYVENRSNNRHMYIRKSLPSPRPVANAPELSITEWSEWSIYADKNIHVEICNRTRLRGTMHRVFSNPVPVYLTLKYSK